MKPTIYTIAVLIAVLAVMWLAAVNNPMYQPTSAVAAVPLTDETCAEIREGMTLDEVVAALGEATYSESDTTPSGTYYENLYWKDAHGSSLFLRTDGKRVTQVIAVEIKP